MRREHRNKTEEEWKEYIECNATHDANMEIFRLYERVASIPIVSNIPILNIQHCRYKVDPRRGLCVAKDSEARFDGKKRFFSASQYDLEAAAEILNAVANGVRDFRNAKFAEAKARYRKRCEAERRSKQGV